MLCSSSNNIVGGLLRLLKTKCLGHTFMGYGGEKFVMDENTPIWIANYGECGVKIKEFVVNEILTFTTEKDD